MKKIGEEAFDVQDPTGKMKRVSAEHFAIYVSCRMLLDCTSQKEFFGKTAKYINHPDLMLDLYKDLGETNKR